MKQWIIAAMFAASAAMADTSFLEGPTSVEFADSGRERLAHLAVKPDLVKVNSNDTPRVIEFASGDLRFNTSDNPLSASWDLSTTGAPALVLKLGDSLRRPGTYQAILAPLSSSQPA